MISSSQPSTDSNTIYSLLTIIADPKAAKQRLDEYEKIRIASEEAQEKHRLSIEQMKQTAERSSIDAVTRDRETAERRAVVERQLADVKLQQKALADALTDLNNNRAELARHAAAASKEYTELKATQDAREAALDDRETKVKEREDNIVPRETLAKKLAAEAQQLKTEYEQKTASLAAALRSA